MADGPAIYPTSDYPAGAFNNFVTGGMEGVDKGLDWRTKADNLRTQLVVNQSIRDTGAERQRQLALGNKPLDQGEGEYSSGDPSSAGSATGSPGGGAAPTGTGQMAGNSHTPTTSAGEVYAKALSYGATPNEAVVLTSSMANESGFNTNAIHDGGIGYGGFGHNGDRLAAMRTAAAKGDGLGPGGQVSVDDQIKFGLQELRSRPEGKLVNQATTPQQLTDVQMLFERPKNYNVPGGGNYAGRLATTAQYMANPPQYTPPAPPTQLADVPSYDPNTLARNAPPSLAPPTAALSPAGPAPAPAAPVSPYAAAGAPGTRMISRGINRGMPYAPQTPPETDRSNQSMATIRASMHGGPSWVAAPAALVPPGTGALPAPAASQLSIGPGVPPGVQPAPAVVAPAPSPQTYLPLVPQQQYALNPVNSDLWGQGYAAG